VSNHQPGRSELYAPDKLQAFIEPRTVAVVGAVHRPQSVAGRVLASLGGHRGSIETFAIGPKPPEGSDVQWYPSAEALTDIGGVDLLMIASPAKSVQGIFEDSAGATLGTCLVFSSGFADGDGAGRGLQEDLAAAARDRDVPLLGPNCLGLIDFPRRLWLTFATSRPAPCDSSDHAAGERLAVVSQSGGLGYQLTLGRFAGYPIGHYLSSGNSIDVDAFDLANLALEDPRHGVVVLLVEGVNARADNRVRSLGARSKALGKPIVVFKSGRGNDGRRAATSHSGTLAGSDDAFRALAEEAGLVFVERWEDLVETASYLAKPAARRPVRSVGIVVTSGGTGVVLADAAERYGLNLPSPSPSTVTQLAELLPAYGSSGNPVDITASTGTGPGYESALRVIAADERYDALIVAFATGFDELADEREGVIERVAASSCKPVCAVWFAGRLDTQATERFAGSTHVSLFRSPDRLFAAVEQGSGWASGKDRTNGHQPVEQVAGPVAADESRRSQQSSVVGETEATVWCAEAGLTVARSTAVQSPSQAAVAAVEIGFPVCVKMLSPDTAHKSELGGIRTGLVTADEVAGAYRSILEDVRRRAPGARLTGCLVQEMVKGAEFLVAVRRDPAWGLAAVVAAGGVTSELVKDAVVISLPADEATILERVHSLRLYPVITGYRGGAPLDLAALVMSITRLYEFMEGRPDIAELEINPLMLRHEGHGAVVVDALAVRTKGFGVDRRLQ
jgi:acyl-CoA synthetase (NDP forming)